MFKLLLIILVPVVIVGGLIYLFTLRNTAPVASSNTYNGAKEVPATTFSATDQSAISSAVPQPTASVDNSLATQVTNLQSQVDTLNRKVSDLQATQNSTSPITTPIPAAVTSSSYSPKSIYIPVGYGGSSTATSDFESIGTQEITLDTGNYIGYKQAYLEVNFKINNGNGTGQARLFNSTDGTALLGSLVSTTSGNYSTVTSSGFNLTSGSKKYTLQLKSNTGYSVDVQLVRIRIDY